MKLLILTQTVDRADPVLGFFHRWIEEFAVQAEQVTVICLRKGDYALPENVRVVSLGKETGRSRLKYLYNFYKAISRERENYDAVLVHMNHEYVLLGGLFWRLWGKKIGLWYAHGHVPPGLKSAERLAQAVITSTKSGFRLQSAKVQVVGQGIDVAQFQPPSSAKPAADPFRLITVGRISPVKDYETLLAAVESLVKKGVPIATDIVGGPGTAEQRAYFARLQALVAEKGLERTVRFVGPVAHDSILPYLQKADMFVTMSRTGSLDKAILEAMAAGLPLATCNEAMREVLGPYRDKCMYAGGNSGQLAEKILMVQGWEKAERERFGRALRAIVVREHGLPGLIKKIIAILS